MYYKIAALAMAGNQIILHYFAYREERGTAGIAEFCDEVHVYPRKSFYKALVAGQPYIVHSRINQQLIARLNQDEHPVLLEGLHCAGLIPFLRNNDRVVLRMHNDEAKYYRQLASSENAAWKKWYYRREAKALDSFQRSMKEDARVAFINELDLKQFAGHGHNAAFIPGFVPWQTVTSLPGAGTYCLYHGDMSVADNTRTAEWLISEVYKQGNFPFCIAGRNIPSRLSDMASGTSDLRLVNNPSDNELEQLIRQAHINLVPSNNATGTKIKLLHALFSGRYCITNSNGILGSGVKGSAVICEEPEAYLREIGRLFSHPFDEQQVENRQQALSLFDNRKNAEKLSALWTHYQ
jgi:hypothetical protein